MVICDQPRDGWTLVLRRQPIRIVKGQPEGGYTDAFEIICCDCGDHPDQDYREVSPKLQLVRGPYLIADGVAAYERHRRLHQQLGVPAQPGTMAAPTKRTPLPDRSIPGKFGPRSGKS